MKANIKFTPKEGFVLLEKWTDLEKEKEELSFSNILLPEEEETSHSRTLGYDDEYGTYVVMHDCWSPATRKHRKLFEAGELIMVQHSLVQKASFRGETCLFIRAAQIPLKVEDIAK